MLDYLEVLGLGLEDYKVLRPHWIRASKAVVIIYDVCSRSSFGHVSGFCSEVGEA
jgi:hypothetical protein